jgi:hypothetical protein
MSFEILYETHATGVELDTRKQEIENLLKKSVCEVTFTKVDGTLRTMPCTMDASKIPYSPRPTLKATNTTLNITESKQPRVRVKSEHNLSAWCTDKQAWRSFKVANVTHVKVINGN